MLEETHSISGCMSDLELRCRTKYANLDEDKDRDRGLIRLQGERKERKTTMITTITTMPMTVTQRLTTVTIKMRDDFAERHLIDVLDISPLVNNLRTLLSLVHDNVDTVDSDD